MRTTGPFAKKPLSGVLAAHDDAAKAKVREHIEAAIREAGNMAVLTNDLQDALDKALSEVQ